MDRQIQHREFLLREYIPETKTVHEFLPRNYAYFTLYILLTLFIINILFLLSAQHLFDIRSYLTYSIFTINSILIIWKISSLKVVVLEMTAQTLLVKYVHPMKRIDNEPSVLEIPLKKLETFNIIKVFFVYFLVINVKSKKGKDFHFRLGFLPKKKIEKING